MIRNARMAFAGVLSAALALLTCTRCCVVAAADDPNPFGVASSAQASGLYAAWMPKMAAAGVRWVRIFPEWNQIEPSAGTWNWSLMDAMVNTAASNHLNVSGLFLYNATWINSNTHTFPTNNYPAWYAYVSNVVRQAGGRVRYWEVWNEPESFAAGGTPADYARVVTNAYTAGKAADPNAQIGLSVASVDILYLEQTIQAGAADHFDFICVHPYEVLGTVAAGQEALYLSIVPTIRKMLAAKNPAKWKVPIWFTEIGEGLGGQITATRQAQDLVKAYTMGIAQGVSHLEWFEAQETNKNQPFPWGGNYTGASSVSVTMGNPNLEAGLHQLNADATSTPVTVYGGPARDCSKRSAVAFTVDPNFLSYTHASIKISAVVRKISAGDNPGFNLKYESAAGRKGIGWNSVPGSDKWYTLTWTIADDEFVGNWGYHFSFDSDSTNYSRYYLQQVTVTNVVPRPASAPTGLMARPGVGLISLNWGRVPGATGYSVKRATISHGSYEIISPPLAATNYTDTGLTPGTAYYYVISAENSGGAGPDSAEIRGTPIAPSLRILFADGTVRLSWPTTATGFALQESPVMANGWTNSPAGAQVQGGDEVAVVPLIDPAKFFRLIR